MKNLILTLALVLCAPVLMAQNVPYNVVFDVTTADTVVHQMVIRWVTEISKKYPEANIEVVYYAKSLGMVTKDKSIVANEVIKMAENKNVSFTVCEGAMKRNNVEKSQLLDGVKTAPDGIYEIVKRQSEGWGYIKASR